MLIKALDNTNQDLTLIFLIFLIYGIKQRLESFSVGQDKCLKKSKSPS